MVSQENKIILGCLVGAFVAARGVQALTNNFDFAFGTLLVVGVLLPILLNEYLGRRETGG